MKKNIKKNEASEAMNDLNLWMEKYYNLKTKQVESTGEAQARINSLLQRLDKLNVKYKLVENKYVFSEK